MRTPRALVAGLVLVALTCPVIASGRRAARQAQDTAPLTTSAEIMGTTFSVTVRGESVDLAGAAEAALAEARRVDRLLSHYRPDSEWSAMNRSAAGAPVQLSDELFDLLARCLDHSRATGGAFDLTVGPLMRAWHFFRDEGAMPTSEELADARQRVGYAKVDLDARRRTVRFLQPGMELDPGGVGKGYAVDRMIAVLRSRGISDAFVSAGGSSIAAIGSPAGSADGWPVTIRHASSSHPGAMAQLRNGALSTSGSTERFFIAGGQRFSHIMDPRTGLPARGTQSVSVIADSALEGELWTKPYFVNGRSWTAAHIPSGQRVYFCDEHGRCRWIT